MSAPDNTSEVEATGAYRDALDRWPVFDVEFVLESDDHGRDQCTLYPREASEEEILTSWISADEGSFVSLVDVR
ncbi:DUF7511 domain-containing protein [Halegenticoccus tardaugens]|uniref:DUF7511 domain-containing protein n=1 Tax=Halegenticoccus tardaugens TaxID=2071624 RepID=UPI00100A2F55|nr:hypothetical protein [Halegenticoccus tardaugens]